MISEQIPDKLRISRILDPEIPPLCSCSESHRSENWKSSKRPSALTRARLEEKKTKPSKCSVQRREQVRTNEGIDRVK